MRIAFTAVVLCVAAAGAAQAQKIEVSVLASRPAISSAGLGTLGPDTGGVDTDVTLKGKYGYGGRITFNTRGYYGHELGYTFNRATVNAVLRPDANTATPVKADVNVQEAFYNFLIYFMPSGERWRPFITGGLQAYRYGVPRIDGFFGSQHRSYGVNWGGGLKVNLLKHALARLDVRDYVGGKPYDLTFKDASKAGGVLHQWEASVGLGITF